MANGTLDNSLFHEKDRGKEMGQRDQFGRRIKWTRMEKKMAKEMKEAGPQPCRPALSYRSKGERLGKLPKEKPADEDVSLPPHLL